MADIHDLSLGKFSQRVAKASPVWAGGSVLAVTSSNAWALLEMVAGLAHRRHPQADLAHIIDVARTRRVDLIQWAEDDAKAMKAALGAYNSETSCALAEIPLKIATDASKGYRVSHHPAVAAYRPAILDLDCARTLFRTVHEASRAIVLENVQTLDAESRAKTLHRLAEISIGE